MKSLLQTLFFSLMVTQICFAQWVQTNGLDSVGIITLTTNETNLFAGGCPDGVFLSTNSGASWTTVNFGLTNMCIFSLFVDGMNLFAGTSFGGVFRSTDSGSSWALISSLPIDTIITCFVSIGTDLFAGARATYPGTDGGVFRSTDNGTSWIPINSGFPPHRSVNALVVIPDGTGGTSLCAGVNICDSTCVGCIYLSTNNGTNWTEVSCDPGSGGSLCVSGQNIFSCDGFNVLHSSDYGNTWNSLNSWPTQRHIMSFGVSGTNIFAGTMNEYGTDGLIFLSSDNGTSWIPVDQGLPPNKWVSSFATIGTNIFAGTLNSGGVWRRPLSEMITKVESSSNLPEKFNLEQNFPNPFNPSTKIRWQSPVGSWQTLKVYDILGNKIATLVNEFKLAGTYEVEFKASTLPSGVYFYQLKATPSGGQAGSPSTGSGQSFVETKKMILLK